MPGAPRGFLPADAGCAGYPGPRGTEETLSIAVDAEPARDVPAVPPLSRATRLWYACGQFAEGVKNESFANFLLFYYNQVLGLSGAQAGLVILIALAFDAVTDPLVGTLSDRTRSRLGRRHPWLFASALPLGLTFYAVFAPPAGLGERGLFLWMLTFTVLCRAAVTLFHVPHLALGAELSDDYEERTLLVTLRNVFQRAAGILPGVLGLLILMRATDSYPDGRFNPGAYPTYGAIAAVIMTLVVLGTAWKTRSQIPYLRPPDPNPRRGGVFRELAHDVVQVLHLRSFRALFAGTTISFVAWGVVVTLGLHLGTYFWQATTDEMFLWGVGTGIGLFTGLAYWTREATRTDKKPVFMRGMGVFLLFTVPPPLLRVAGYWPEHGTALYIPIWILTTGTLAHFGIASTMVTGQSMMADTTDEDELRHGRRREGIFFGASSFAAKCAFGVGGLVAGRIVDFVGLVPGSDPMDVGERVVRDLGLTLGGTILILVGASLLAFARYDLTRERHAEIRAALDARARDDGG